LMAVRMDETPLCEWIADFETNQLKKSADFLLRVSWCKKE